MWRNSRIRLCKGLIEFRDQDADFGIVPVDIIDQPVEYSKKSYVAKTENYWRACERGRFNKVLSGNMFRTVPLHTILKKVNFLAMNGRMSNYHCMQTNLMRIR